MDHPSWSCLFDLLAVCENFIFYSPIIAPSNAVVGTNISDTSPSPPTIPRPTTTRSTSDGSGGGGVMLNPRRTASILQGVDDVVTSTHVGVPVVSNPSRPKEMRYFKTIGLHMSSSSASSSSSSSSQGGQCQDMVLIEKVLELLESLKLQDLETTLDANAESIERERMKKLKKRSLCEIEFFVTIRSYFQQQGSRRRSSTEESSPSTSPTPSPSPTPALPPSLALPATTTPIRSVPELLEKRRHQRLNSGGGRLSGMIHHLTRSRRLRSMEQKLNGFVVREEAQDRETSNDQAVVTSSKIDPVDQREEDIPRPRRDFPLLPRRRLIGGGGIQQQRPMFHDVIHTKLNLELVKLKIEAHYLTQKGLKRSTTTSTSTSTPSTQSLLPPPPPPPPIPTVRPSPNTFQKSSSTISQSLKVDPSIPADPVTPLRSPVVAACDRTRRHPSTGIPITSLLHLMSRPLPIVPPDRQVIGPIVLSPKHGDDGFEPKVCEENEFDQQADPNRAMGLRTRQQRRRRETTARTSIIKEDEYDRYLDDVNEEDENDDAVDEDDDPDIDCRCMHCCRSLPESLVRWHFGQSYCRTCFRRIFTSCAKCSHLIDLDEDYVRITGLETFEDQQPMVIHREERRSELERPNRNGSQMDLDTIMYHKTCLECQDCCERQVDEIVAVSSPSDDLLVVPTSSSKDDAAGGGVRSSGWYHHLGRIYCHEDYNRKFGKLCEQCCQIIPFESMIQGPLGRYWHSDCFVCANKECGRVLTKGKYYLAPQELISPPMSPMNGKITSFIDPTTTMTTTHVPNELRSNRSAYCESCFKMLFECCHFCSERIQQDETGIHVKHAHGKRPYHKRCYQVRTHT